MSILQRLNSFFLLALLVSYFASGFLFPHVHIIDGAKIVHSHIYNPFAHNEKNSSQDPPDGHHHSKQAINLIFLLELSFLFSLPFTFFLIKHIVRTNIKTSFDFSIGYTQKIGTHLLRDPPASYFV